MNKETFEILDEYIHVIKCSIKNIQKVSWTQDEYPWVNKSIKERKEVLHKLYKTKEFVQNLDSEGVNIDSPLWIVDDICIRVYVNPTTKNDMCLDFEVPDHKDAGVDADFESWKRLGAAFGDDSEFKTLLDLVEIYNLISKM